MGGVMLKLRDIKLDDIEVPDIPTMYDMTNDEYIQYVKEDHIAWLDHHDVLRERNTGLPIATTLEQLDILIDRLISYRGWMKPKCKAE